jgi:hypothetical protein
MLCRKTDGIPDSTTTAVVQLDILTGGTSVDTNPKILRILSAYREDDGRDIEIVNRQDMRTRGWRFDGVPGRVAALITGMDQNKARVFPVADEDITIFMSVFRLPLVRLTTDGDQTLEVAEEHHRHLLLWMRHLGYLKHDTETFDQGKADDFETKFERYCESVKREERRKAYKVRTVAYGGIGNFDGMARRRDY